ncbi:MAG: SGNH/GDSL hydrolase family protein [Candidatus Omnitrophica bacterium]|nr:SGNH/GDSL hydrolase family protein [Candidatus Omnitrophota bacterium]
MASLKNFLKKIKLGEKITIVALGDSITELTWHTRGYLNWVGLLQEALMETYGRNRFWVINSGRCGERAQQALNRLKPDVYRFQPDLVIISYGMNDATGGKEYLPVFRRGLQQLIQTIKRQSAAEIILQTPNPVVDQTGKEKQGTYNGLYAKEIVSLGRQQNCVVINHYQRWKKIEKTSDCLKEKPNRLWLYMADSVHPGPLGHRLFFREIAAYFNLPVFLPWEI